MMDARVTRGQSSGTRRRTDRGLVVMALAIVIALAAAIISYAMLIVAGSQARQSAHLARRTVARYAAEAALIRAQARLWQDPAGYCGGVETIEGINVTVVVTPPCGPPGYENQRRTLTAQIGY